jgi:hypothetical protein
MYVLVLAAVLGTEVEGELQYRSPLRGGSRWAGRSASRIWLA